MVESKRAPTECELLLYGHLRIPTRSIARRWRGCSLGGWRHTLRSEPAGFLTVVRSCRHDCDRRRLHPELPRRCAESGGWPGWWGGGRLRGANGLNFDACHRCRFSCSGRDIVEQSYPGVGSRRRARAGPCFHRWERYRRRRMVGQIGYLCSGSSGRQRYVERARRGVRSYRYEHHPGGDVPSGGGLPLGRGHRRMERVRHDAAQFVQLPSALRNAPRRWRLRQRMEHTCMGIARRNPGRGRSTDPGDRRLRARGLVGGRCECRHRKCDRLVCLRHAGRRLRASRDSRRRGRIVCRATE